MKRRAIFSNICSIVIIVALAAVLLAYFNVIGGSRDSAAARLVINIALPLAIVAVAVFDIVLPVIYNRKSLKDKKFILKLVIKSLLFAGAMIVVSLTLMGIIDEIPALIIFVILYFAQFFISLDGKSSKNKKKTTTAAAKTAKDTKQTGALGQEEEVYNEEDTKTAEDEGKTEDPEEDDTEGN